jgi:short-subunit dehydrogenase
LAELLAAGRYNLILVSQDEQKMRQVAADLQTKHNISAAVLAKDLSAAFQPGPFMVVYYAAKAFVLSFSEGLAEELRSSGVTVTTLCPGPTATQFSKTAQMQGSMLFKGRLLPPVLDAATVARIGYRGPLKGQRVVVPGWMNKIGAQAVRFLPRSLVSRVTKSLNHPKDRLSH